VAKAHVAHVWDLYSYPSRVSPNQLRQNLPTVAIAILWFVELNIVVLTLNDNYFSQETLMLIIRLDTV
jgi:hypothetical protein